jgi:DNA-binding NarL/FixJ family response regulator
MLNLRCKHGRIMLTVANQSRNLLLVEDEPLVASLLGEFLVGAGFNVATAHNAIEASKLAVKFDPDIAVLDINLGQGASGVELAYILDQKYPGIALLLLTKHPDLRTAGFNTTDVPAGCGFIRKDLINDKETIVQSIEEVILSRRRVRQDIDPTRPLSNLTSSQIDVLRLVAQGYTNSVIAAQRKTSIRAVELMLNTVYTNLKIDVDGELNPRVEAVRKFITAAGTPKR